MDGALAFAATSAPAKAARPQTPPQAAPARGLLRFITCGSVDDGKSTLIGRLLFDAGAVALDQIEALNADSRRFGTQGTAPDFALLVDGLAAEREQGITIDVAYRYFATLRRAFIVADTPGHEQYTRNMATGASTADLAVILVDARKGVLAQTRRHAFIVSLMGVRQVIVAVNKMDLVDFEEAAFRRIEAAFGAIAADLGFAETAVIPVCALDGDNVAKSSPSMPWYGGPSLLARLETAETPSAHLASSQPFHCPVQWVNRPDAAFRGVCGTIAAGAVALGDPVVVLPTGTRSSVAEILGPSGPQQRAEAGEVVTLRLGDDVDASRGDVLAALDHRLVPARRFRGRLLWMSPAPLDPSHLLVQIHHVVAPATLTVHDQIDIETYRLHEARSLPFNGIGHVTVTADRPVVVAPYRHVRELGAFILINRLTDETVALGVVDAVEDGRAAPPSAGPRTRLAALGSLLAPVSPPLGPDDRVRLAIAERLGAATLIGLLVGGATGSVSLGIAAGLADAVLRVVLHAGLRAGLARRARVDTHADGSGI